MSADSAWLLGIRGVNPDSRELDRQASKGELPFLNTSCTVSVLAASKHLHNQLRSWEASESPTISVYA